MPFPVQRRVLNPGSESSSRVRRCPARHRMLWAEAEQGMCDRCYRPVQDGEAVLDCRRCNWYVCMDCLQGEEDGVWGTLSALVGAASREMAGMAMGAETFASELKEQLTFSTLVDAASREMAGVAMGAELLFSELGEQLSDARERMSCQPTARSRSAADEEIEIPLAASGRAWSDDDGDDVAASPASQPATDAFRCEPPPRSAGRADLHGEKEESVGAHADLCGEEAEGGEAVPPAQPVTRELSDLIDLGQRDLLDTTAEESISAPAGHAARREALDLFDLPGPKPKLETQAGAAPSGLRQTWIQAAQAGA